MNKEQKAILKTIKDMMKEAHGQVPYIKELEKKIRKEFAEKIKEAEQEPLDYWRERQVQNLTAQMEHAVLKMIEYHDCENHYYLIYKDGSFAITSDEELISGEKMPKLTDIVYAKYEGVYDSYDTETGELHWYEGVISDPNFDYEAEDARKNEYENGIEIKYGTEHGKKLLKLYHQEELEKHQKMSKMGSLDNMILDAKKECVPKEITGQRTFDREMGF